MYILNEESPNLVAVFEAGVSIKKVKEGIILFNRDHYAFHPEDFIHTSNLPIERVKAIDKNYSSQMGYEWLITVHGNGNQYKPVEIHGKILATIYFKLEGVPEIEIEDQAMILADAHTKNLRLTSDERKQRWMGFMEGYEQSKKDASFSIEQLTRAIELARQMDSFPDEGPKESFTASQIINLVSLPDRIELPVYSVSPDVFELFSTDGKIKISKPKSYAS